MRPEHTNGGGRFIKSAACLCHDPVMHEIELKFQVPAAARRAVEAAVAGRSPAAPLRLQAAYFDTADSALAAARLALRLRREGRRWVQTLKGAGPDGMTRLEHNVALADPGAALPAIDPARHAGTPAGERLLALLSQRPGDALEARYRTEIRRRSRVLRTRGGSVELAFDVGRIEAGARQLPVCELEIELARGEPSVLIEVARRWVARHGLWLDLRSKAERGEGLAGGELMAPPRGARPVELERAMDWQGARRAALRSCADQVLANASQVADGHGAPEHVHQLRVGLRRLRSALRFFALPAARGAEVGPDALADAAAKLFRRLGSARDTDVLRASFGDALQAALRAAGVDDALPPTPVAADADADADPAGVVRDAAAQSLWLDLLAAGIEPEASAPPPGTHADELRAALAARLARWHSRAAADARRFAELSDDERHRLRKRVKRLRYAVEFSASLFGAKRVRRYLKPLRGLQERLGALNDVAMALAAYRGLRETQPRAWFVLGWLAARRAELLAEAGPDLAAFAKAPRFWKRD